MNPVVVYLASPLHMGHLRWSRLDCLQASIKLLFRHWPYLWPVIIFHEDYTEVEFDIIRKIHPQVTFRRVSFSGLESNYVNHRPDSHVGKYGYCQMCHFFCGPMQRHPALDGYDCYMRLDDDSYIVDVVGRESVDDMLLYDYSFLHYSQEEHTQLYSITRDWLQAKGMGMHHDYSAAVPYNNFHLARQRLFRDPLVIEYLAELERMYAWTGLGFTDAMVHKMMISALAPNSGLSVHMTTLPYRHNQHCGHSGNHTQYCQDGTAGPYYWGPPNVS